LPALGQASRAVQGTGPVSFLAIAFGLALLVWSADRFAEGSAVTARHLGMPPLLIRAQGQDLLAEGACGWCRSPDSRIHPALQASAAVNSSPVTLPGGAQRSATFGPSCWPVCSRLRHRLAPTAATICASLPSSPRLPQAGAISPTSASPPSRRRLLLEPRDQAPEHSNQQDHRHRKQRNRKCHLPSTVAQRDARLRCLNRCHCD
jgi:hypothetical protein